MYSIVLMMAMTTAPEQPQFGGGLFRGGCSGSCNGCYGSCTGYSCTGSSCYGSSCYGGGHRLGGRLFGGCHGSSCYGGGSCHGSCYGSSCHGGPLYYETQWSSSCYGSCYGTTWGSSYSCHGYGIYGGACYGQPGYAMSGGSSCYGYGMPMLVPAITTPSTPTGPAPKEKETVPEKKMSGVQPTANQAAVHVRLPADAKLYAQDQLTQLASSNRQFLTPKLEVGQIYQYVLKVEYVREGKPVSESKTIQVKAGQLVPVEFEDVALAAKSNQLASSKVTVQMPEDAKLYVDNQLVQLPANKREFRTPALRKGEEFAYNFRAEVTRDGKKQAQTQVVTFKAGENVEVDFRDMMESKETVSK